MVARDDTSVCDDVDDAVGFNDVADNKCADDDDGTDGTENDDEDDDENCCSDCCDGGGGCSKMGGAMVPSSGVVNDRRENPRGRGFGTCW
jgi:hypothetical protein